MQISIFDYYVSVLHEKSVNLNYSFDLIFYGKFGTP